MSKQLLKLGDYRPTRLLRVEGSAEVWQAHHRDGAEMRAVKFLAPQFRASREHRALLRHEYQVARGWNHANVNRVLEFDPQAEIPFLVLEFFGGQTLRQILRDKEQELLPSKLPQILEQAAAALSYVHEHGWVHGNVKPNNLLIGPQCELKLVDFSIARRSRKGNFRLWGRGQAISGTPSYMSPEQIRRQALVPQSDIYSLGCVLFEAIEGRPPYTGASHSELLNKHLSAPIPHITANPKLFPASFLELLEAMLAKRPEQRPATMLHVLLESRRMFQTAGTWEIASGPLAADYDLAASTGQRARKSPKRSQATAADAPQGTKKSSRRAPLAILARFNRSSMQLTLPGVAQFLLKCVFVLLVAGLTLIFGADFAEWRSLARFSRLADRVEAHAALEGGQQESKWTQLEAELQEAIANVPNESASAGAQRHDHLQLGWAARTLPDAIAEGRVQADTRPSGAKVQAHLTSAQTALIKRSKERLSNALNWRMVGDAEVLFWNFVILDIVGVAWLVSLFIPKRRG